ncbi:UNVERIFIED_CONTAM: hypothetical protein O8I53_11665 [Campylobacter lari]
MLENNQNYSDEYRFKMQKLIEYNGKIPFYTDFGVLELEVDLTKSDEILSE